MSKKVIVIGGGASGMMAAITAARSGASVIVLEQSDKPLKKLLMTGNGRCNLTNLNEYKDSYRSSSFGNAREVLGRFGVRETIAFFESIGVFTKERGGWVYPVNDQASSVASHLLTEAERLRVKIKNLEEVKSVQKTDTGFLCGTATYEYAADAVIIASGTCAHFGKGFTGIAPETAARFGIDHISCTPALVPLMLDDKIVPKWGTDRVAGKVTLIKDDAGIISKEGELQLTSYGISGIPVLQISSFIEEDLGPFEVKIDFLPMLDETYMIRRIEDHVKAGGISVKTALSGLLPEKLFKALYQNDDTAEGFIKRIKGLKLKVKGKCGLEKAMVCKGGVSLCELTADMESVKVKGLYFTGEAADIDGDCGGFNLQWAWSSGHAAGAGINS